MESRANHNDRKTGKKNSEDIASYRPISLLPILSKILEKILLQRLTPIIEESKLIPSRQFGFRMKHGTIEQPQRLVNKIHNDLENRRYCSAAFIDISQAFDKVWHTGLFYKLKRAFPHPAYTILKSYLTDSTFQVRYQEEYTTLHTIQSAVPHGSILGPILYSIYTADLPEIEQTMTATYADDTAILASHQNPITDSTNLQHHLNQLEKWLKRWHMKANKIKSIHITFSLKRETCPAVILNGQHMPQTETAKYLSIHLDCRLTWQKHIFTKRKQLGLQLRRMYWIIGRKSKLSLENKLLIYKTILKSMWTYGIPPLGYNK